MSQGNDPTPLTIWTIGHSTRSWEEFVELLLTHGIRVIVDVRNFPGSRRYPHFNKDPMTKALPEHQIDYHHLRELGGRRAPRPDSKNTAWRNAAFRGYADYMESAEFHSGIRRLRQIATERRTAFMCSEAVWWRCHRSLISDYLKSIGVGVLHILSAATARPHPYTAAAHMESGKLTYHERQLFS